MNTPTAANAPDPSYIYGPDDYFAFVESIDPLILPKSHSAPSADSIDLILSERAGRNLPPPARAIWLDCVQSQYFMRLSWKDELCEIGNLEDSNRRRENLQALDRQYFRAAFLLTDPKGPAELGTFHELNRATGTASSSPPRTDSHDRHPTSTSSPLPENCSTCVTSVCARIWNRKSLANAFSPDFLPTAQLKHIERGNPNSPPRTLPPTPELELRKK
jgi:hypothetical protein